MGANVDALSSRSARIPDAIGSYRIVGKLGEGGMGVVYEAEQASPRRRVALKVIRGGAFVDDVRLRLFQREAETLARLEHPNIGAIYESGRTEDGQHYFAMELVRGKTLDEFVGAGGPGSPGTLDLRERLALFHVLCDSVSYAHQRGVVHRDLKSSNILVAEGAEGAGGTVKVLDFGLARITDSDVPGSSILTQEGTVRGTLATMSPEQARGDTNAIDVRSDVYSLGVILYRLLTGGFPYDVNRGSFLDAIHVICETPPIPLRVAAGRPVDADLETIALKALAKEPGERYSSAAALGEDVHRWLTVQPILARPPSTMYQVRKLVARHRWGFGAAAAVFGLVIAFGVVSALQARRIARERDRAEEAAAKATAIRDFLQEMLSSSDPYSGGNRERTVNEALRLARDKIGPTFASQPAMEAEMHYTVGEMLSALLQPTEAEEEYQLALPLFEETSGPDSTEVANVLEGIAQNRAYLGDPTGALAPIDRTIAIRTAQSDPALRSIATALTIKAKALLQTGDRVGADSSVAAALQWLEGADATLDRDRGEAMFLRSSVATASGDYKRADSLNSAGLEFFSRAFSPDSPRIAHAINDWAVVKMYLLEFVAADSLFREAMRITTAALGPDHHESVATLENWANLRFREEKFDESLAMLEDVLARRRRTLGDESPKVARSLLNLGSLYGKTGRLEESEKAYREAIPRMRTANGNLSPDVASGLFGLAATLVNRGKLAEAEPLFREALAIRREALGEEHALTGATQVDLGLLLESRGRIAEAESLLVRGRATRFAAAGEGDSRVKKADEALERLQKGR